MDKNHPFSFDLIKIDFFRQMTLFFLMKSFSFKAKKDGRNSLYPWKTDF